MSLALLLVLEKLADSLYLLVAKHINGVQESEMFDAAAHAKLICRMGISSRLCQGPEVVQVESLVRTNHDRVCRRYRISFKPVQLQRDHYRWICPCSKVVTDSDGCCPRPHVNRRISMRR